MFSSGHGNKCCECGKVCKTSGSLWQHQISKSHCVGKCALAIHAYKSEIKRLESTIVSFTDDYSLLTDRNSLLTDRNSLLASRCSSIKATPFPPSWQGELALAAMADHTEPASSLPLSSFAVAEAKFQRKDSLSLLDLRLWKFMVQRHPQFDTLQEVRDYPALEGVFNPAAFMLSCKPDKHFVDLVSAFLGW